MDLRFFIDFASGQPHIYIHGASEPEVDEALAWPFEDGPGSEGSRIANGQSREDRYLRVGRLVGTIRHA